MFKKHFPSWIFINSVTEQLFEKYKTGFFIEAGAYDGEFLSNTLSLEEKRNWTGLLVEPDQDSILKIKSKNRKSWVSPTCLGTNSFPYQTILSKFNPKEIENKESSKIMVGIKFDHFFSFIPIVKIN